MQTSDLIIYKQDDPDGLYRITYENMDAVLNNNPELVELLSTDEERAGFKLYCQLDGDNISFDEAVDLYEKAGKRVPKWLREAADNAGLDYWYEQ